MTDTYKCRNSDSHAGAEVPELAWPPEVEPALEEGLARWAIEARLPSARLAQIRGAVLADDAAYEPLTPQWWKRVLSGAGAALRTSTDVRAFLEPEWSRA